jgi:hypothetical protein
MRNPWSLLVGQIALGCWAWHLALTYEYGSLDWGWSVICVLITECTLALWAVIIFSRSRR